MRSAPLHVGELAPDFTLPSTRGQDITLSSFRGSSHVVVAFFPLAFTDVCTAEMCAFTDDFTKFSAVDAIVLGISVDSIPTLVEFKSKYGIAVDLLSDFKREVSRAYGVLLEDQFLARRSYFIVDTLGVLTWAHVEDDLGQRRRNTELLEQLAAL